MRIGFTMWWTNTLKELSRPVLVSQEIVRCLMNHIIDLHVILNDITKTAICDVTDYDVLVIMSMSGLAAGIVFIETYVTLLQRHT